MTELGANYGMAHGQVLKGTALDYTITRTNADGTAFSFTDYDIAGNLVDSKGATVAALDCSKSGVDDVNVRVFLGASSLPSPGIYRAAIICTRNDLDDDAPFCLIYLKITISA